MKASKAVKIWLDYHRAHSRPSTARAYEQFIATFDQQYGRQEIDDLTQDRASDQVQLRRMKKRKLAIKDQILKLESSLIPDLDA